MINIMINTNGVIEEISKEEFIKSKISNTVWIDIKSPSNEDYNFLQSNFQFHNLHIEHCKNKVKRAKIDDCSEYLFVILTSVYKTNSIESIAFNPIYIFIGEDYIITIHDDKNNIISGIKKIVIDEPWYLIKGADYILYNLFKEVIEQYFVLTDKLEEKIDYIQDEVMNNPSKDVLNKIMEIKRKIIKIRKNLYPKREILTSLLRIESKIIKKENAMYFSDIYDHILIIHDMVEGNKEMLAACLELYSSQLSNKTNDVMKFLTIITTIMMPITVITGIYGMNFEAMPELSFKYSYLIFWIVIMLSIVVQLLYFKRKKWL